MLRGQRELASAGELHSIECSAQLANYADSGKQSQRSHSDAKLDQEKPTVTSRLAWAKPLKSQIELERALDGYPDKKGSATAIRRKRLYLCPLSGRIARGSLGVPVSKLEPRTGHSQQQLAD